MLYISVENEGEFLKITIPRLSTSNAITFCRTLQECQRDDTYFFDVSGVNNYEPLPMLLTAASIRQFCEQRDLGPWDIQLLYSENKNYDYACHMGFFQAAGFPQGKAPGEAPGSSSYIPLTKLNIGEMQQEAIEKGEYMEQGDLIERKSDELAAVLAQGNRELQKMFRYLIREAIRNVPEHAGTNEVWICGQYWHNRDKAEIAILDEGIGVYESLKQNRIHREYVTNNEEALRWAIKPGISVAFNPARGQRSQDTWANSGYGLFMISEICKATNGWLTFVSGDDCLRVYPNGNGVYGAHFKGTALGIRIKPSCVSEYQSLIDSVRKSGEDTAKAIKNSFKEASTPSKGLMY